MSVYCPVSIPPENVFSIPPIQHSDRIPRPIWRYDSRVKFTGKRQIVPVLQPVGLVLVLGLWLALVYGQNSDRPKRRQTRMATSLSCNNQNGDMPRPRQGVTKIQDSWNDGPYRREGKWIASCIRLVP